MRITNDCKNAYVVTVSSTGWFESSGEYRIEVGQSEDWGRNPDNGKVRVKCISSNFMNNLMCLGKNERIHKIYYIYFTTYSCFETVMMLIILAVVVSESDVDVKKGLGFEVEVAVGNYTISQLKRIAGVK